MTQLMAPAPPAFERPVHQLRERGQLLLPSFSHADRVALFHINAQRSGAFTLTDTPQGARLEAGPYVGVFTLATCTVQVRPKAGIGTGNLLFMLARTMGRQWSLPQAPLSLNTSNLQEELAALFVHRLRTELQRGLLRRSQNVQEELPVLRGRLRVAAYMRQGDRSRLPVEYVDLTANHPANRLFLLVLERLLSRVSGWVLRQHVAELRVWLREAGVTPWPATPHDWSPFTLNRLQRRYDLPLTLARMLLEGWGAWQDAGPVHGQAFAFNMDRLFEQFLTRVLVEDVLPGTGYVGRAQRPFHQREYLFQGGVQELLPDLTVLEGGEVRLIIDFKNKRLGGAHNGSDLYQMYSYARHLHCGHVLLIYPDAVNVPTLKAAGLPPLQISAAGIDLKPGLPQHLPDLHEQLRAFLRGQGIHL
ncbi:McrC family protein [Deinococcus aquaedulcis]|uniref:McrC family protein n=1 Tax=Deinococcus aquaedulcis TaxID=2840455 RepID=UPI001C837E4D|nr:McrC family protein [Deinococcus aquaedulcis]